LNEKFRILDNVLKTNEFLAGKSLTIADVTVAVAVLNLYRLALDEKFRKNFTNI